MTQPRTPGGAQRRRKRALQPRLSLRAPAPPRALPPSCRSRIAFFYCIYAHRIWPESAATDAWDELAGRVRELCPGLCPNMLHADMGEGSVWATAHMLGKCSMLRWGASQGETIIIESSHRADKACAVRCDPCPSSSDLLCRRRRPGPGAASQGEGPSGREAPPQAFAGEIRTRDPRAMR